MSFEKAVEGRMVKINENLYASKYEISNQEYNTFLKFAKETNGYSLHQLAIDSLKWIEFDFLRNREINIPMKSYYHNDKGFNNYPVVNVSYDGALAYCQWLTEKYNNEPKRKFKKVIFTLPTEDEWITAAKGGRSNAVYPWEFQSLRHTGKRSWQGMFLANFSRGSVGMDIFSDTAGNPKFDKIPEEYYAPVLELNDRAFYTAEVNSFFPNAFGIYNMSGNVAEMTIQKGLTKGGSWHSLGGEITIQYRLYFNEPSPEVGFRVFMKILEN